MELSVQKRSHNPGYCGVPQCNTYRSVETPMFKIPKYVKENPKTLKKWATTLRMGKRFPTYFKICSKHFNSKHILKPASKAVKINPVLLKGAFPCHNLPVLPVLKKKEQSERSKRLAEPSSRILFEEIDNDDKPETQTCEYLDIVATEPSCNTIGTQCNSESLDKGIQVYIKPYISIISLWDTDKQLNTMTGIPTKDILNALIEICRDIRPSEKCIMPLKDRIVMSFHKLKSNCSFAELAIFYQTSDRTAKLYFADTIQLLAKATNSLIYWQTKEENLKSLPKCFKEYSNVKTILDCTEIKTATFNCLTCRVCTYSHYKGTHTLKFLIGVSPSGSINFVSNVATGRSSDKAIFNFTDLIDKLEKGDAVMVDKGFLIGDELAIAGVEMIRPEFFFQKFSKADVEKNTNIASARVHVERRIARLKQFRILRDKICLSVIPYIDEIVRVL